MRTLSVARLVVLSVAALIGSAGTVAAQSIPSPYRYIEQTQSLALVGGYLSSDRGELGLGPASGPLLALRYTGRFALPVAGVIRLTAGPSERTIFARSGAADPEAPLVEIDRADGVLLMAEAGLRLNLTGPRTWNSLAPYLEGTGGLITLVSSRTEPETQIPEDQVVDLGPAFAVGLGAGTDWFLTERFSLGVGTQLLLRRQTVPAGLTGSGREDSEWTKNLGVTLGAAFHF